MSYRNIHLTGSANGETCVSCGNPQGVVWAHCNEQAAGKGMGTKAHDLMGAYLCQDCHEWYDRGQSSRKQKKQFFLECFFLTMVRVAEKLEAGKLSL
jgi:hypothetical protein